MKRKRRQFLIKVAIPLRKVFFDIALVFSKMANFERKFATFTTYVMPAVPYAKSNCLTLL